MPETGFASHPPKYVFVTTTDERRFAIIGPFLTREGFREFVQGNRPAAIDKLVAAAQPETPEEFLAFQGDEFLKDPKNDGGPLVIVEYDLVKQLAPNVQKLSDMFLLIAQAKEATDEQCLSIARDLGEMFSDELVGVFFLLFNQLAPRRC